MSNTVNFRNFHTVHAVLNITRFFLTGKKFRENNFLVTLLVKTLFSRIFCQNIFCTLAYYQECNVQKIFCLFIYTTIDVEHCINVHKSAYMNVRMNFSNQIVMKYLSGLYKIAYPCHLVYEI